MFTRIVGLAALVIAVLASLASPAAAQDPHAGAPQPPDVSWPLLPYQYDAPAPSYPTVPVLPPALRALQPVVPPPLPPLGQGWAGTKQRSPAAQRYLGRLSANPYLRDSTSNPYRYGYGYGYGRSPETHVVGQDGTYLGKLNANPLDPDSIANPFGRYGNPYNPDSVNNPYGRYGSPYSPDSATNPYAVTPPLLFGQ